MKDDAERERAFAIFDPLAEEYLTRDGVDIGAMFGSEGLRIRGKVFAFVGFAGGLVVKVPEARADEIEASGVASRMEMRGRPAREWLVVPTSAAENWGPLMAEAFAYLDEITP
ncbi:TfoX/Sxy family protein [Microbacterium sp. NPDC019599]|uniref:TfoX/Sxy family protein n=1 Tax=Microbacterium sp. NPDC019599 TaxID=3154690 RepID=UPI0033F40873